MRKASDKPLLTLIETSKANNFVVPSATEIEQLIDAQREIPRPDPVLVAAIAAVKAAGYRVSKPRKPKIFKRGKDRVGPTFVCEFADGTTTRMSTFTSLEKLDWERGERLSQAAYQSRWRARLRKQTGKLVDSIAPVPPTIVAGRFELNGKVLAQRTNGNVP